MTAEAEKHQLLVATILKAMGNHYRVDTYGGPAQWWFRSSPEARFVAVHIHDVWRLARKAILVWAGIPASVWELGAAIQTVQKQVPLLTHEEWLGPQHRNHPRWRAA